MTEASPHPTLAACLIVRDEEKRLPDALASVAFCEEIVVVDSGSRDRTAEIARAAGARVVENAWPGFAAQRNVALDHARADWVLEIDADERVTPALARAVRAFVSAPPPGVDLAAMPRRNRFLGAWLTRAAVYPDYRFRLLRRGAYRHDEARTVHEGLLPRERVWALDGDLEHVLADNLHEAWSDMVAYARLESRMIRPPVPVKTAAVGLGVRPAAKFLYRLLLGGGWRDGWRGALWISRDCVSDALVWAFALAGARGRSGAPESGGSRGHFGVSKPQPSAIRLIGVARGATAAGHACGWLGQAAEHGADVALVTDAEVPCPDSVRVRRISRFTPSRLLDALDAEHQLQPADAVLPAGWRERAVVRLFPGKLRGRRPAPGLGDDPGAWVRAARPDP